MRTILFLTILAFGIISEAISQNGIELTFTAVDSTVWIRLDSIRVMNRTHGGDTVLYWPDTVLSIYFVGDPEFSGGQADFKVYPNYPNPVKDQTTLSLFVPEKDKVRLEVSDMTGRVILETERVLDVGTHSFRFTRGSGHRYLITAKWRDHGSSIKILCAGSCSTTTVSLEYSGSGPSGSQLKVSEAIHGFSFSPGDKLLYIGYEGGLQSGMPASPEESDTCTFRYATNIPCPGTPTVTYEGRVYNTIQIFSQCWLSESLNVGVMIPGITEQSDNGIIEKYCYNNDTNKCAVYGGFYLWNEMMQYTTQQGVKGICPQGWHIPTDEEWKVLGGAIDSLYGIGDPNWDLSMEYCGYDVGMKLKSTSGWSNGGNGTDLYGFSGLPGGYRDISGLLVAIGNYGIWWSSTEGGNINAYHRNLSYYSPQVYRGNNSKKFGNSVRCVRDE